MGKASRRKRLWQRVHQQDVVDNFGRDGVLLTTPREWLNLNTGLPPEKADEFVKHFRAAGGSVWLRPMPDGTVRTRMMIRPEVQLDGDIMFVLQKYARDIAKAVARSGDFQPPPGNAFGDQPLPTGGTWWWDE